MNALIVEDDDIDAQHMARILRGSIFENVNIRFARTLEEAQVQIAIDIPTVMILDLALPPSTAMDTLRGMADHIKNIPTLVVTGRSDAEAALLAIEEGALGFLLKSKLDEMLCKMVVEVAETWRR